VRAFVVVAVEELIEAFLLLEQVLRGRLGGFLLQGQVHPLVAAVSLRMPGLDALDRDAQAQPPYGEGQNRYKLTTAKDQLVTRLIIETSDDHPMVDIKQVSVTDARIEEIPEPIPEPGTLALLGLGLAGLAASHMRKQ